MARQRTLCRLVADAEPRRRALSRRRRAGGRCASPSSASRRTSAPARWTSTAAASRRASSSSAPSATPTRMRAALDAFAPHVVVVFRPEIIPAGAFADLRAAGPRLPHRADPARDGDGAAHWDLDARRARHAPLDRDNFDRIVSFDPLIVADRRRVHGGLALAADPGRRPPLPARPAHRPARRRCCSSAARPRTASAGCSTSSTASTACTSRSASTSRSSSACSTRHHVTFNVHNEPYPTLREPRLLHLAAGHLVITEPLSPSHGLESGIDYVEVQLPRGAHARRRDGARASPTPTSASASAAARRPSSTAPRASGRGCSATSWPTCGRAGRTARRRGKGGRPRSRARGDVPRRVGWNCAPRRGAVTHALCKSGYRTPRAGYRPSSLRARAGSERSRRTGARTRS